MWALGRPWRGWWGEEVGVEVRVGVIRLCGGGMLGGLL